MLYANGYPVGGGGGGSDTGGHTIIDENGNSMTARAGLQFVGADVDDDATNNKTIVDLASAGGIDGVFYDMSNVIVQRGDYDATQDFSYTATQDCAVFIEIVNIPGSGKVVRIDNEWVGSEYSLSGTQTAIQMRIGQTFLLKKGQTLTVIGNATAFASACRYAVYGIQTGTTHSKFQPVIYSFEEREIGVWIDGKPLYEKTLAIPSLSARSNTIQHNIANFDKMVSCQGRINYDGDDLVVPYMQTQVTSGYVAYGIGISNFNSTRYFIILGNMFDVSKFSGGYVTVRYTKTTDVAGSGSWTPQGVPTHHYSTDEQVIGTWIDGSTIYEKTWDLTGISDNFTVGDWTVVISNLTGIGKIIDAISLQNESVISFIEYSYDSANSRLMGKSLRYNTVDYVRYLTLQYTKSS